MTSHTLEKWDITVQIKTENTYYVNVFYTYKDPQTGKLVKDSPTCRLSFKELTYCIFTLAPASVEAGWVFTGLTPHRSGASVQWWLRDLQTSLTTLDTDYNPHSFFLNFYNNLTGQHISDDPQEGNIPPPPPPV